MAVTGARASGEAPWGHVSTTWAHIPAEALEGLKYRFSGPSSLSQMAAVGAQESAVSLRGSHTLLVSSQAWESWCCLPRPR